MAHCDDNGNNGSVEGESPSHSPGRSLSLPSFVFVSVWPGPQRMTSKRASCLGRLQPQPSLGSRDVRGWHVIIDANTTSRLASPRST